MAIVLRRVKATFLRLTDRFASLDPRMGTTIRLPRRGRTRPAGRVRPRQDRLFLSGHGLDTIREIAQQFPRDGQLGVRMAEMQRSREFASDLMDFVDPEMSFGDFIHGANQAFVSWRSELDRMRPCRHEFAAAMRCGLFAGNDEGWRAYAAYMRKHVSWFAADEAPHMQDKARKTSEKVVSEAVAKRNR
jgi:hypothetical protein